MCERYGVWKDKKMYGKIFPGIERSTFVIDGAGRLAAIFRKVRVNGHESDVLEAVEAVSGA